MDEGWVPSSRSLGGLSDPITGPGGNHVHLRPNLGQRHLIELYTLIEMFYIPDIQYLSHQAHVAL